MALNLRSRLLGAREAVAGLTNTKQAVISVEMVQMNKNIARDFIAEITEYPPETAGNRPPPPYWSRGVGMVRASGEINPASQKFGDSWRENTRTGTNGATTSVETPVTYAPWVVGTDKQTWFHREHGWRTIKQVLSELGVPGSEKGNTIVTDESNVHVKSTMTKIRGFFSRIFSR